MRISDWSSDVCSSDLVPVDLVAAERVAQQAEAPRLAKDEGELPAGPGEIGCGRVEGSEEAFQRRGASRRAMAEKSRTQDPVVLILLPEGVLQRLPAAAPQQAAAVLLARKSTRLNSSHYCATRMPHS